jgi:hypothetical protein
MELAVDWLAAERSRCCGFITLFTCCSSTIRAPHVLNFTFTKMGWSTIPGSCPSRPSKNFLFANSSAFCNLSTLSILRVAKTRAPL